MPTEESLLDTIADQNLQRLDACSSEPSDPRKFLLPKAVRHSKKYDGFYYEVPHYESDCSLELCLQSFPNRQYYDGYSFYLRMTTEESIQDMLRLAKFLLENCQCLRSIEFDGHIGPTDIFKFCHTKEPSLVDILWGILIDALRCMPNLETISFYNIRYIPLDRISARLLELFITSNLLGKLLLPATNCTPQPIIPQTYMRIITENPTRGKFICNRWSYFDFKLRPDYVLADSRSEMCVMFKTLKAHFRKQKENSPHVEEEPLVESFQT